MRVYGIGVDDGTRTHDDRNHNPGLYQLSYTHH
jgi:integrase